MTIACLVPAASAHAAAHAADGRLLVGFERGVSKDRQARILSALEGRVSQRFAAVRGGRLVVVRWRSGKDTGALRKRLARHPDLAYAEPDFTQFASQGKAPNDPLYALEWALADGPADHDIDAPEAWLTRSGCAKVAILDTDHPDLAANVYESEDKPNNGKDDDKNGYVDDVYGYNAINGKGSGQDDNGHGTHVAASWARAATTRSATPGPAGRRSSRPSSS